MLNSEPTDNTAQQAFLNNFRQALQSAKDFKDGKTNYMNINDLMDEL